MVDLLLRRQRLRVRIAAQRLELADLASGWRAPLHAADTVIDTLRFLREHPTLLAGAAGLLAWRRGGSAASVAKAAWRAWGIYRAFASFARLRRH
jgi:hypothetical protein